MPTLRTAFRAGRLSYTKVRETTRVVDLVDDAELCALALTATAAQLATTIAGYRTPPTPPHRPTTPTRPHLDHRENGTVDIRAPPPQEDAAVLLAALNAAKDQYGTIPAEPDPAPTHRADDTTDTTPAYTSADALLDIARVFLDTAPEDRSGEDRTLVVVHVSRRPLTQPRNSSTRKRSRGNVRPPPGGRTPATSKASAASNPTPPASSPATPTSSAPSSTATAASSPSAAPAASSPAPSAAP